MSYRLNVPYSEKDEAKSKGAKWNYIEKFWYCLELTDDLRRWYEEDDQNDDPTETDGTDADPYAKYKTVARVNTMIREKFERTPMFSSIYVKGEITDYRGPNYNGNYFFSLKDDGENVLALLPCAIWAGKASRILHFNLTNGKKVAVIGNFEFYTQGGSSRLIVSSIQDMGAGLANERYQQLFSKLQAEGLFNAEHKKPVPKFPKRVGIITSKNGQAIKDIEKISRKRNPYVQLLLYHVNVQGINAVSSITAAIPFMDALNLDTLIIGRGGGSDEELNAYNDETIARLVYNAATPVISAVGHEGNWTILDNVADLRAATPSEAAEFAIPDVMTSISRIEQFQKNIADNMRSILSDRKQRLHTQEAKLAGNDPVRKLKEREERLKVLSEGLNQKISVIYERKKDLLTMLTKDLIKNIGITYERKRDRALLLAETLTQRIRSVYESKKNRFDILVTRLNGLSPTAKLVKGFGYITVSGKPVVNVSDVKPEDEVDIRIHDGRIVTTVKETIKETLK